VARPPPRRACHEHRPLPRLPTSHRHPRTIPRSRSAVDPARRPDQQAARLRALSLAAQTEHETHPSAPPCSDVGGGDGRSRLARSGSREVEMLAPARRTGALAAPFSLGCVFRRFFPCTSGTCQLPRWRDNRGAGPVPDELGEAARSGLRRRRTQLPLLPGHNAAGGRRPPPPGRGRRVDPRRAHRRPRGDRSPVSSAHVRDVARPGGRVTGLDGRSAPSGSAEVRAPGARHPRSCG